LAEGSRELIAWQVEKGKPFSVGRGKIIGRLNHDLNGCLSSKHLYGDFVFPEVNFMATSVGAPDDGVWHVCPLLSCDPVSCGLCAFRRDDLRALHRLGHRDGVFDLDCKSARDRCRCDGLPAGCAILAFHAVASATVKDRERLDEIGAARTASAR
jgi:hypothetical protein